MIILIAFVIGFVLGGLIEAAPMKKTAHTPPPVQPQQYRRH